MMPIGPRGIAGGHRAIGLGHLMPIGKFPYMLNCLKICPNKAKIFNKKISKISEFFISKIGQTLKEKTEKIFVQKLIHESGAVGIHTRVFFALGSPWLFLVTGP